MHVSPDWIIVAGIEFVLLVVAGLTILELRNELGRERDAAKALRLFYSLKKPYEKDA